MLTFWAAAIACVILGAFIVFGWMIGWAFLAGIVFAMVNNYAMAKTVAGDIDFRIRM
jgi:putative flippase GtrA